MDKVKTWKVRKQVKALVEGAFDHFGKSEGKTLEIVGHAIVLTIMKGI